MYLNAAKTLTCSRRRSCHPLGNSRTYNPLYSWSRFDYQGPNICKPALQGGGIRYQKEQLRKRRPHTVCAVHLAILGVDRAAGCLGAAVTAIPIASAIVLQANICRYTYVTDKRARNVSFFWGTLFCKIVIVIIWYEL